MNDVRGVTSSEEINEASLVRDVRPLSVKIYDFVKTPRYAAILILLMGLTGIYEGALTNVFFILMFIG